MGLSKKQYKEKRLARLRELVPILAKGVCPECGCKLYPNHSITGWIMCGHKGSPGFQKEPGPECSWDCVFDPNEEELAILYPDL
jgi:hypothetical protein